MLEGDSAMTMPAYKDYYKILGVTKNASHKEIRSAYRDLARRHHPDVNLASKEAAARFQEIHEAYAVLMDPQKRGKYDALVSAGNERPQQGHRPGAGPSMRTSTSPTTLGAAGGASSGVRRTLLGQLPRGGRAGGGLDLGIIRVSLVLKTVDDRRSR
jgi:DnaJ-class molecular chaperone